MSRTLTESDRSSLIRLASTLPAGSAERKAILDGLAQAKQAFQSNALRSAIYNLAQGVLKKYPGGAVDAGFRFEASGKNVVVHFLASTDLYVEDSPFLPAEAAAISVGLAKAFGIKIDHVRYEVLEDSGVAYTLTVA